MPIKESETYIPMWVEFTWQSVKKVEFTCQPVEVEFIVTFQDVCGLPTSM